ncbi:helix-turn-helix domain-containing protein [Aeoliella mucimassa]|uniref:Transposase IS30-like HTH domain-containing protein n=1 Tax=Aeoliella mucimassa TaxID=2527972 RepID=A0A518AJW2_9BACT|nr:helix-turn-helix domain-containing protein [Aeoliella mucimassa]QDU54976.1 hypothetical protein Pan181_11610 [Aeoliella mucimassa]
MARKHVLDEVKQREICALITAGMSLRKVARYVGCDRKTIYRERQADPEFDRRVRRAEMAADLTPLELMRRAAATHWRAAAWMLERRERREAARQHVVDKRAMSDDDLDGMAREVQRIVDSAMLGPYQGPIVKQQISLLFNCAKTGRVDFQQPRQLVEENPGESAPIQPDLEQSIAFLEQRFAERESRERFAPTLEQPGAKRQAGDSRQLEKVPVNQGSQRESRPG